MTYSWLDSFLLTFVPLFIVIDALGNIPFVLSISEGMSKDDYRKLIRYATMTAVGVGLLFLFLGTWVLNLMGISVGAFAIAGGIVLLALSIRYMTTGRMVDIASGDMVGIVPIGTPLTVGPATITTLLLLSSQFPLYWVLFSFILNIFIVWLTFVFGKQIVRFIGRAGIQAVSRIAGLLLAAIAVNMIIRGLDLVGILNIK